MPRRKPNRGVVLIIVLSLLALFTLLMVTFVIVTGQYRQAAASNARVARFGTKPEKLMDDGVYTLLRDTDNPNNVLRFHSLLYDLYGDDGFSGSLAAAGVVPGVTPPNGTSDNFFDLRLVVRYPFPPINSPNPTPLDSTDTYHQLSFMTGYYNGCVLNVVSGDARGRSFRIVGYIAPPAASFPDPALHTFRVMPIASSEELSQTKPSAGDRVVINGRPFNGTGFAFNSSASAGGPQLSSSLALQPNRLGDTAGTASYVAGGPDESYDAPDFQNMAMAAIIPVPTSVSPDGVVIIPSFHRPALVNYEASQGTWAARRDRAMMRPMPWRPAAPARGRHRTFTGSNSLLDPAFWSDIQLDTLMTGQHPTLPIRVNPWDVDNDGDRIPDSIWVDLGHPAQRTADGRLVKPLFAFLCLDLDGRLNLNAIGSPGQVGALPKIATTDRARSPSTPFTPATAVAAGEGYGPPEINAGFERPARTNVAGGYPLFENPGPAGQYATVLADKYGPDRNPGMLGADRRAKLKFSEYPANYFTNPQRRSYGSLPDLFGEFTISLDHRGQPTSERTPRPSMISDNPYEFNGSSFERGTLDNSYSVASLERILRYNDGDVRQLPDRLIRLANVFGNTSKRRSVTTASVDIPVPPVLAPAELRTRFQTSTNPTASFPAYSHGRPLHVSDLLAARLTAAGVPANSVNNELAKMLPTDLLTGARMDVNRPFGDGLDNDSNGVTDEHGPTPNVPMESALDRAWSSGWNNIQFDHDNDPSTSPNVDGYLGRHLFARHLYVLLNMLCEKGTPTNADRESFAQWAVNVVDFRDADSIMTVFEYDANPFNGWNVDGNILTDEGGDRAIVWGCERPELLISETLAFHDRRTEDLDSDLTGKKTTDAAGPDNDFDSRLRPRGSLFVELYNPWSGNTVRPAEFYSNGTTLQSGVVLNKRAPSTFGGTTLNGAPVWRMLVVGGVSHNEGRDPDHPAPSTPGVRFRPQDVERGIYFADPASVPPLPNETRRFSDLAMTPLAPGGFAVVGSGEPVGTGPDYITTIGRRKDAQDDGQTAAITDLKRPTTRRIVLSPNATVTSQVQVLDNITPYPTAPTQIQPPVAVVINRGGTANSGNPRDTGNLNISEPAGGYTAPGSAWTLGSASGEGAYAPPADQPLDDRPQGRDGAMMNALSLAPETPGTPLDRNDFTADVRTLVLQRLANPLLPYNAQLNPYRTVDRASIDLTVFEGVWDPANTIPDSRTNPGEAFGGRERGSTAPPARGGPLRLQDRRQLWASLRTTPPSADQRPGATDAQVFNYELDHTLGYLSEVYGSRFVAGDPVAPQYYGAPRTTTDADGRPFPWLNWNNRPFVSQLEMMLVPLARSSQLLELFGLPDSGATPPSPYLPQPKNIPRRFRGGGVSGAGGPGGFPPGLQGGATIAESQYGHLLNFFATSQLPPPPVGTPPTPTVTAPDLYRIFDYTHVPSRFVGTEKFLDPTVFQSGNGTELRHPPFNTVPTFREPGKVNINTIFEQRVWDAVIGRHDSGTDYTFAELTGSRRGYAGGSAVAFDTASGIPTFFANPFRSSSAGDLVPVTAMQRAGVDTTLLRSPALTNGDTRNQTDAMLATTTGTAHVDPHRNPYFRYQSIQRLSNLVTTRSNVYAVWLTVGFFEVDPTTGDLGQEVGRDTGTAKRHRAFYILDRSIPVAFEPGENHNVDKAILLRRIIQ